MGMTQGFNLEALWKNINMERWIPEPSGNKETDFYLTLSPLHEIMEFTGSKFCSLLAAVFRRLLNNSYKNMGKNGAFGLPSPLLDIRERCFTTSDLNGVYAAFVQRTTRGFMLYLFPNPSCRWKFSYSSSLYVITV